MYGELSCALLFLSLPGACIDTRPLSRSPLFSCPAAVDVGD